ncbi:MAG: hypothetical protein AAGB19_14455, partial [Cyanobacteria bacterium P01_F01_bin.3]
ELSYLPSADAVITVVSSFPVCLAGAPTCAVVLVHVRLGWAADSGGRHVAFLGFVTNDPHLPRGG